MRLHIGDKLSLPADTVTSTLVVYGGKGMGKTVLGAVLAEELAKAGLRWAWLDPIGVSWGLRHSADGAGPGVECLILGGPHGDIPIEPAGGAAVADVVVEESVNVLIDFSRKPSGEMWGVGEKIRFVNDYARRLFQRQGDLVGGHRREPLFQVLDEAARYVPQVIPAGNPALSHCVGAWQQLVEEGRNIGLGCGLITQRSARINKDVAELADAMVAFRTIGPNSLEAVLDWLGEHVEKARIKDYAERVRSLDRGQALVVSPGWLKFEGVVKVRMRETFDSSATPKPGERPKIAKGEGAKPDLASIRERMAATIERAKAEDPRALQARVRELEESLRLETERALCETVQPVPAPLDLGEVRACVQAVGAEARQFAAQVRQAAEDSLTGPLLRLGAALDALEALQREAPQVVRGEFRPALHVEQSVLAADASAFRRSPRQVSRAQKPAGGGERRMLVALAAAGARGLSRQELALQALMHPGSGTFSDYLSKLRTRGAFEEGERLKVTAAGRAELNGERCGLLGSADLLALWTPKLSGGARRMFAEVFAAYPRELTREQLGQRAHVSPQSGTFSDYLSKLNSNGLIEKTSGGVRAAEELFIGGR